VPRAAHGPGPAVSLIVFAAGGRPANRLSSSRASGSASPSASATCPRCGESGRTRSPFRAAGRRYRDRSGARPRHGRDRAEARVALVSSLTRPARTPRALPGQRAVAAVDPLPSGEDARRLDPACTVALCGPTRYDNAPAYYLTSAEVPNSADAAAVIAAGVTPRAAVRPAQSRRAGSRSTASGMRPYVGPMSRWVVAAGIIQRYVVVDQAYPADVSERAFPRYYYFRRSATTDIGHAYVVIRTSRLAPLGSRWQHFERPANQYGQSP
jgi:hypothetical protein